VRSTFVFPARRAAATRAGPGGRPRRGDIRPAAAVPRQAEPWCRRSRRRGRVVAGVECVLVHGVV